MEGVVRLSRGCGKVVLRVWEGCQEGVGRRSGWCGRISRGYGKAV